MDEERTRILKMLEEGKITAQEAEKLLLALKGQPRPDLISSDELRSRMRRFGLREMRHMPEVVGSAIKEAVEDGLNAAVRRQRFEFESRGRLLIRNVSGDTVVEAWDKPTVLFDRDEGGLWKANEREGMIMAKVLSGDLQVRAPRRTGLTVNSVSGDIAVTGVQGKLDVKSVSGDIALRQTGDAVDVSTTSGDIKTRDIEGKCHITTVSGDIDLGFCRMLSGLVETRSGDVRVWVPSDADVLLEAEVVLEGEVSNEVEADCQVLEAKAHHLRLGFGKHQNHLWVRCRNGDISVRSYEAGSHGSQAADDETEVKEQK
jgi:hypothetical protein